MSAVSVIVVLGVLGAASMLAGSYLLAGTGVSLLVGGVMAFLAAGFLRSGMMSDGP